MEGHAANGALELADCDHRHGEIRPFMLLLPLHACIKVDCFIYQLFF